MQRKHTAKTLLAYLGRNWPEAVTPTSKLMMRVYRLSDIVRHNAQQQTSRFGLTFTEFEVLVALRSAAPPHELIPTDLYQAILISSGGLTKLLLGLEKRGLIARGRGEVDRFFLNLCGSSAVSENIAMGGHAEEIEMVARPRG